MSKLATNLEKFTLNEQRNYRLDGVSKTKYYF